MVTIRFKSQQEFWRKEYLGIKNNTVRTFSDASDIRKEYLDAFLNNERNYINIELENNQTKEVFSRLISDVTKYNDIYIITWKA